VAVGDFNICLDHADDPHSIQLHSMVNCYGLMLHSTAATHQLDGILDAVISREDVGCPSRVDVIDVGISDHQLVYWEVSATCVMPASVQVCSRAWRQLGLQRFRSALSASRLCQPDDWPDDVDNMANVYVCEFTAQLDDILPMHDFVHLQTPGLTKTIVQPSI